MRQDRNRKLVVPATSRRTDSLRWMGTPRSLVDGSSPFEKLSLRRRSFSPVLKEESMSHSFRCVFLVLLITLCGIEYWFNLF